MTEFLATFHFIRPLVLLALPVLLLIVWHLQRNSSKDDGWAQICDAHLLDALKVKSASKGNNWLLFLWPIVILATLATAGPAFRKLPTPVLKNQSALILVLDVSKSMLADDLKPNRLERAKYKIEDILAKRKDGQTALLVYAGDAFVVTPLTDDTETIALMLKAISPEIMPVQGSRVDIALQKARDLLKQAGYSRGEIVLIGDGVKLSSSQKIAKKLSQEAIKVSVLAVGTAQGAPIPSQNGFVKDANGKIVIPKLEIDKLQQLAQAGNGRFSQITGDSSDIDYLIADKVENQNNKDNPSDQQKNQKQENFGTDKYIDEGPWLTLLLIPFMVLMFRKGLLLGLFLIVGLHAPTQQSYAFGWDDLWQNADQQAAAKIKQGDAKTALEIAQSDAWKASAAYKNKDYKQAAELFNGKSLDDFYNQGNALAQSGKLEQAIKAYDDALKINPKDEDTLYNKEQVKKALEKQKKQQQNKENKENKDKKDNKDNKDQKNNKDNKDKQDQKDSKDQQEKDQQDQKDGEKQEGQQNQEQKDNPDQQKEQKEKDQAMSEEEKKKQQEEKEKLKKADKQQQEKDKKEQDQKQDQKEQQKVKLTPEEMAENAEKKEAIEQWLRRIPDDPGGLLRRKFYYQYNRQNNKPDETEDW